MSIDYFSALRVAVRPFNFCGAMRSDNVLIGDDVRPLLAVLMDDRSCSATASGIAYTANSITPDRTLCEDGSGQD